MSRVFTFVSTRFFYITRKFSNIISYHRKQNSLFTPLIKFSEVSELFFKRVLTNTPPGEYFSRRILLPANTSPGEYSSRRILLPTKNPLTVCFPVRGLALFNFIPAQASFCLRLRQQSAERKVLPHLPFHGEQFPCRFPLARLLPRLPARRAPA